MSSEQNKRTVRRFYEEVINQNNLAALDSLLGDHYVSHDLPSDPAALKGFIDGMHTAFPDGQLTIDQLIAEGDTVAMRGTYRGTQTGRLQDIRQLARQSPSRPRTCIGWLRGRSWSIGAARTSCGSCNSSAWSRRQDRRVSERAPAVRVLFLRRSENQANAPRS